jgi:hypothetical protein
MDLGEPPFLALPVFLELAIIWVCFAVAIPFEEGQPALYAGKRMVIKASGNQDNHSAGRGLVALKTSVVDAEFYNLNPKLRTPRSMWPGSHCRCR